MKKRKFVRSNEMQQGIMQNLRDKIYLLIDFLRIKFYDLKMIIVPFILLILLFCIGYNGMFVLRNGIIHNDDEVSISFASSPFANTEVKKNFISIPNGTIKANPFLPYKEIETNRVSDVPQFDLVEPPDAVNENSDAARVMDTIVSGILYDKFSPSAILNIEGNDYLVKKGDIINNYKVLNIQQDSVTVKLGNNTYKAGIGEILTEGEINTNIVSNLNKKFGGKR